MDLLALLDQCLVSPMLGVELNVEVGELVGLLLVLLPLALIFALRLRHFELFNDKINKSLNIE